jgi:NAD(P)-dependent dehydrogenase (short-subunit alcohol dehydrogenase family)
MHIPDLNSLLNFEGRVVMVTGGSGGLGQGIAQRFAQAGAKVVVQYHANRDDALAVVGRIKTAGGQASALLADLTQVGQASSLVEQAVACYGRIDALINNAGIYPQSSLVDMPVMQWDAVINANLRSAFLCTQAAARRMIRQGDGGAIINITSIEAENPAPQHSHYSASKAGVFMMTRAAAAELGRFNIRVNAVAPGLIWREGLEQSWAEGVARYLAAAPLGRLGRPEDVADACLFLASDGARWITGASLTVDGGVMTNQVY